MYACRLSLWCLSAVGVANAISLQVSTTGGNASSPLLYGLMFEDINYSGDGGIHGQLLRNNGFQGDNPNITGYEAIGNVQISQDTSTPLSAAITSSLKVTVPAGATGKVGFLNQGYNGVPVLADTYKSAFYIKGDYSGAVTVFLKGAQGDVYATKDVMVNSTASNFSCVQLSLDASASPAGDNTWNLEFDAAKVNGGALWFDLVKLYPTTFHARSNGLRKDISEFVEAMSPSFLRFPGGNNLEGNSIPGRWIWNNTIGLLKDRPGRQGTWGYPNTDALGLMEYFYWAIDMNLKPVLGVFAGFPLGGPAVTGDALKPYIQEVMDELEFILGDSSTQQGALRAKYGQQAPFELSMVEIGNEDNLGGGCSSYASRFTDIYQAIHSKYPSLRIISSTSDPSCLPSSLPESTWSDLHHYERPDTLVSLFSEFDNTPRSNDYGIFVGEFSCSQGNDGNQLQWPTMEGSVAEAVYMIGLERNSDVIKMAAYAPLLEHRGMNSWTPNLIAFDSSPGSLTGSTSYYVQKLFSTNRGATILPVKADGDFKPLFWTASSTNGSSPTYYVKLANYGGQAQEVTVSIPGVETNQTATLQSVSGGQTDYNQLHDTKIQIQSEQVTASAGDASSYSFQMPGWAAAVLTINTS